MIITMWLSFNGVFQPRQFSLLKGVMWTHTHKNGNLLRNFTHTKFSNNKAVCVFWNVASCNQIDTDRRFGGTYCFHHEGVFALRLKTWPLKTLWLKKKEPAGLKHGSFGPDPVTLLTVPLLVIQNLIHLKHSPPFSLIDWATGGYVSVITRMFRVSYKVNEPLCVSPWGLWINRSKSKFHSNILITWKEHGCTGSWQSRYRFLVRESHAARRCVLCDAQTFDTVSFYWHKPEPVAQSV
jgi:hypothetical protein